MKNTTPWAVRALSRLLVMVMAVLIGFGPAAPSFAQSLDPVARGLAANAKTTATRADRINRIASIFRNAKASNPWDNPVASSPPTIGQSATHDSTLTQNIPAVVGGLPNTTKITCFGGLPTVPTGATFLTFPSVTETPQNGNLFGYGSAGSPTDVQSQVSWACEVEFWGSKMELEVGSSASPAGYKIQVDGAYVSKTAVAITASQKFLSLDWGTKAHRRVRIECQSVLSGIWIGPTDEVRATDLSDVLRMVWVGNSWFRDGAGSNSSVDHTSIMPFAACAMLGVRDCRSAGIGSTGYIQTASRSDYLGRLASVQAFSPNPDAIVISDSGNDYAAGQTTAAITARALLTWQAYRAAFPTALIIVTGQQPRVSGPSAAVIAVENALKAQFDAWADPFSVWVPISTDAVPWVTTANSSVLMAADLQHLLTPPTGGNASAGAADAQIGRRMADGIRTAVEALRRQLSANTLTAPGASGVQMASAVNDNDPSQVWALAA